MSDHSERKGRCSWAGDIHGLGSEVPVVRANQNGGHHNRVGASSGRHAKALVRAVFYFNWRPRELRHYSGCRPRFRPWEEPVPGPRSRRTLGVWTGSRDAQTEPCNPPPRVPRSHALTEPAPADSPSLRAARCPALSRAATFSLDSKDSPSAQPAHCPHAQSADFSPRTPRLRPLERLARHEGDAGTVSSGVVAAPSDSSLILTKQHPTRASSPGTGLRRHHTLQRKPGLSFRPPDPDGA